MEVAGQTRCSSCKRRLPCGNKLCKSRQTTSSELFDIFPTKPFGKSSISSYPSAGIVEISSTDPSPKKSVIRNSCGISQGNLNEKSDSRNKSPRISRVSFAGISEKHNNIRQKFRIINEISYDELEENSMNNVLCKEHKMTITCWCTDCKSIACYKCLLTSHKKHDVESIEDEETAKSLKRHILSEIALLRYSKGKEISNQSTINEKLKVITDSIHDFNTEVTNLEIDLKRFSQERREITQIRTKIYDEVCDFERSVNETEDSLSIFKEWETLKESVIKDCSKSTPVVYNRTLSAIVCAYQVRNSWMK